MTTQTDRELLEAAARAAGLTLRDDALPRPVIRASSNGHWWPVWNPLTDDGDALRLAVKLGFIAPGRWPDAGLIALEQWGEDNGQVDWCAATRRAIVRAAAEIGKEMK